MLSERAEEGGRMVHGSIRQLTNESKFQQPLHLLADSDQSKDLGLNRAFEATELNGGLDTLV